MMAPTFFLVCSIIKNHLVKNLITLFSILKEKGVVGELDLGMGFGQAPPPDPIEQLTEKMTSNNNVPTQISL